MVMAAFILVAACIAEKNPVPVTVANILEDPTIYANQSVELKGSITSQCGSGCWFIMSDTTGEMYVTLSPNNFVIPPAMGKEVTVNGTLAIEGTDVALVGSQVLLDGKTYS